MKLNWGKGIAITYAAFVAAVIIMVSISISKNVDLVTPNYYEKEIKYQDDIDMINNTNKLAEQVGFEMKENGLVIIYPSISTKSVINGEIFFYRPSDSKKDFKVKIDIKEKFSQEIDLNNIDKGLWKIKILWNMDGKDYLSTNSIIKQ